MMKGSDYDNLFIAYGWYAGLYEVKMVFLFLFMLIMCIVVNNALIGLAVGDAYDVKRSAMFDKFRRKVSFFIQVS
jgi:Na+-transporting methylmalonyl-CoA/oxaloacetate decarboxylase gamma subunit